MSFPTGMSPATGSHYNNVAAQMQAYLHGSGDRHQHSAHGNFYQYQPAHPMAYASQAAHSGVQLFGIDPVISSDVGGFARIFMRNLLR